MIKKYKSRLVIRDTADFSKALAEYNVDIPYSEKVDVSNFNKELVIGGKSIPNRFCIQPMEGCDGDNAGNPSELTYRKYKRFAAGGAGIIWLEATAVVPEGRANPRQLWIHRSNIDKFKKFVKDIRDNSYNEKGEKQNPYLVLQLTHSGRESKPTGKAEPMIAHHSKVLAYKHGLTDEYPLITDEYLDDLQDKYVEAAQLAKECGFDAVDVKSCHGYLLHEILSAFTRENSKYGGSYENRTRFLKTTIKRIMDEVPGIGVSSRLSIADGYEYPYAWGMKTDGSHTPDLTESIKLIGELRDMGVEMLNIAIGNPYFNPNFERPYDFPIQGFELPEEHPLVTLERNIKLTSEVADAFPDMIFITSGTSWLRQMTMNVGDYMLSNGKAGIIGLGRMGLAYPDFPNDFFKNGRLNLGKVCITCSSCTQMMRDNQVSGCVIRDGATYADIFYKGRLTSEDYIQDMADSCKNCWGGSCSNNCPAGIDVVGFIKAFYDGDVKKSYEILTDSNKIPETCAYTCPSEVLCERTCSAGILGKHSVPIAEIQKFICTKAREEEWTKIKAGTPTGRKVAVIGFGGAGIACATTLIESGVEVVVYEAANYPGGTAEAVIPFDRLPAEIFKKEVESFDLDETGLFKINYNTPLTNEFNLDTVLAEGFDAIFIGAGMCKTSSLKFDNKPDGVFEALDFLYKNKTDNIDIDTGMTAAVIGGGNTAMDTVAALKNRGLRNVYLIYRRSFHELPAWNEEVRHALDIGVHFMILSQPISYAGDDKITGVRISHTMLGELDDSGRARPVIIPDSEYTLPVDICVEATGQKVDEELTNALIGVDNKWGIITVDENFKTSREKVYAGGDIVNGGTTLVQAAGEGRKAAEAILKTLV